MAATAGRARCVKMGNLCGSRPEDASEYRLNRDAEASDFKCAGDRTECAVTRLGPPSYDPCKLATLPKEKSAKTWKLLKSLVTLCVVFEGGSRCPAAALGKKQSQFPANCHILTSGGSLSF